MTFVPQGTEAMPCLGMENYTAGRPPLNQDMSTALIVLSIVLCILFLMTIPPLYRYRNEPAFYRVRPFWLSFLTCTTACVSSTSYLLPEAVLTFPCSLMLVCHVYATTVVIASFIARALAFIVETQISIVLSNQKPVIGDDTSSHVSGTVGDLHDTEDHQVGVFFAIKQFLLMGYAVKPLSKFTIHDLSQLRRNYAGIMVFVNIPPVIILLIGALVVGPYHSTCVGCIVFVEFFVIVLSSPLFFNIAIIVLVRLAFKIKQDEQRVIKEMFITMASGATLAYIGYGLELADPGRLQYERKFTWRFILILGPICYWIFTCLYPLYLAYTYERFRKAEATKTNANVKSADVRKDFMSLLNSDPQLKLEFYQFAASRYCMESLNFVEDVKAYKNECEAGQSDKWKKSKARNLIKTYVQEGAPQEVNISSAQRKEITELDLSTLSGQRLSILFNVAYEEVVAMLASGTWIDYLNEKKRKAKKQQNNAAVANVGE